MARLPKAVTALPSRRVAIVGHGVVVCHRVLVTIFGPEDGNSGNLVSIVEPHDDHAPCAGAVAIDALDVSAHDLTAGADEQKLFVVLVHELDRSYPPGLGALDRDERHALSAAVLPAEFRGGNALAVAGLRQDEDVVARLHDAHADDLIGLVRQPNADDAGRIAPHRAHLALAEAADLAQGRGEDDVVVAG